MPIERNNTLSGAPYIKVPNLSYEIAEAFESISKIFGMEKEMDYTPKRILRSGDRTIVFWEDGTKTIVKLGDGEVDSPYTAFTAALAIKIFGSNSAVNRLVKKKVQQQKPYAKRGKEHDKKSET